MKETNPLSDQDELDALRKVNQELRKAIEGYSDRGTLCEARSLPTDPLDRLRADNDHLRNVLDSISSNDFNFTWEEVQALAETQPSLSEFLASLEAEEQR